VAATHEHEAGAAGADDPVTAADGSAAAAGTATAPGRYGAVLLLIVAAVVAPFLLPGAVLGPIATAALQTVTVLAALRASDSPAATVRVAVLVLGGLLAVAVVAGLVVLTLGAATGLLLTATGLVTLALAAYVPVLIVGDLVRHRLVTLQTVWAALCVYLLLGLAFASLHLLIDGAQPGSYTRPMDQETAIYLSYVTLTTVGFGDVTPLRGPAQAATLVEAIGGQLYLVSVVAALVGSLGRTRR
jgi:hypothetical protein